MAKPPKDRKGAEPPPRRNGVRDVGSLLPDVGGTAFRRFGFVQGALLARWRDVVGPVYARWSVPESLRYPRGQSVGGTLTIRVEGPFSLQLQHVAPQIIDRANRILGANAVAKLKLVQGEVPKPAERPQPRTAPVPNQSAPNLSGVKDEGLRAALEELAAQLGSATGTPPKVS
ncbi:DUF721 domain-containing protein [Sandaracinobacter neustonicus]|uniref:DUF721 domain-containing protein n=1 Tax=Sandaracinobacter neustonicus TaxID=1715348 RepID=A0A501XLG5_9SPHN|nr:DciA family protein [Sandaracinobacter neustonicus]TPE61114.1 DUF721 domain-containing protein [Sandaracinobacter neustonicus]